MRPSYDDVRRHILGAGQQIIALKGFAGVGLNEILGAADVPKGSFYHYFGSKEQYGCALIEQYVQDYLASMDRLFHVDGRPARERLMTYWQRWRDTQCTDGAGDKCLVVKLGAEVADLSDDMRQLLRDGTDRICGRLEACVADGIADGSLAPDLDPAMTATKLYQMWLGASLLTKLRRDLSAFDDALAVTERVLARPGSLTR
ncbi:TetR/AcrR family transcriptional regulator [Cupriavidus sp. IDO]|uniref:TetR/AcrR family transcriptional regulator n=1 Tax=Cupriavidus sp. IDO TaxID=1539142 RepID=UPI0005794BB9|nr:TetR/AcrR family transcriptional regulator [Cupriavidus sp. IDO]KWR87618.1 TetR family transcriptional regulator [Cupriavidus sp. IDO]